MSGPCAKARKALQNIVRDIMKHAADAERVGEDPYDCVDDFVEDLHSFIEKEKKDAYWRGRALRPKEPPDDGE